MRLAAPLPRTIGAPLTSAALLVLLLVPSALGIAASAAWNAEALPVPGLEMNLQSRRTSCGPALIAALSTWRGHPLAEETVLAQATMGDDGISLAEFARLASLHELGGAWYQIERRRLDRLPPPFVVHLATVRGGHYLAVVAARAGTVVVLDPAAGALVGPASTLLRDFSGRVFLFQPGAGGSS